MDTIRQAKFEIERGASPAKASKLRLHVLPNDATAFGLDSAPLHEGFLGMSARVTSPKLTKRQNFAQQLEDFDAELKQLQGEPDRLLVVSQVLNPHQP